MSDERRLAILHLSKDGLMQILTGGVRHFSGLPADARLVDVTYSWERRGFALMLQSESFAPVPGGMQVPQIDPPIWKLEHPAEPNGISGPVTLPPDFKKRSVVSFRELQKATLDRQRNDGEADTPTVVEVKP
jgi:hypothetical protein